MAPRNVSGSTMMPNRIGTCRGSKRVPNDSPSAAAVRSASGVSVSRTSQLMCRCTGVAGTTAAIGKTSSAANRPVQHARGDLARSATSQIGQRREHAVLDLLRVAELLHERQRDRLDALKDDRQRDTPATRRVENAAAAAPLPPTPWPILREHVREHEHEQERLQERARDELLEVLAAAP